MGAPTAGRSTDDPVAARTVPGGRRSCPPASGPAGCGIPGNGGAAAGISVLLALIRRSLNGVSEFRGNSLAARISYPLPCCAALISAPRLPAEIWQTGCSGGWLHPDHARLAGLQNLWHCPGPPGRAPAPGQPGFLCSRTQSPNPRPDTGNVCRAFRPGKIAIGYRLQTHSNGVLLSRSGTSPRVRRVRSRDPVT